ncbi:NepR family anti-sigma factor [Mongoliimonas terrestris]|uniref:NepR family anti-sigma factor n=1 Tax=Mongoliimonas terrestris TaxID=1709001 RepID=UPI000949882C|nr:NepR family anti-sigma factor [Mongoliimonas terrestris]
MTRDNTNKDLPERALNAEQPDRDTRPMSPDLQAHIGLRLKAFYDSVLSEPIPDRFAQLLDRLDDAEAKPDLTAIDPADTADGTDSAAAPMRTVGSDIQS